MSWPTVGIREPFTMSVIAELRPNNIHPNKVDVIWLHSVDGDQQRIFPKKRKKDMQ
jgi:hypothetical protein